MPSGGYFYHVPVLTCVEPVDCESTVASHTVRQYGVDKSCTGIWISIEEGMSLSETSTGVFQIEALAEIRTKVISRERKKHIVIFRKRKCV